MSSSLLSKGKVFSLPKIPFYPPWLPGVLFFFFNFWSTLVPQPGIELMPLALQAQSLKPWTIREVWGIPP